MTVSFLKLHTAGTDCILIDRQKEGHAALGEVQHRTALAKAILQRTEGVGASALIYLRSPEQDGAVPLQVYLPDGEECFERPSAWVCAARYLSDAGYSRSGSILLRSPAKNITLSMLDSRSFSLMLEQDAAPSSQSLIQLIVDGIPLRACRFEAPDPCVCVRLAPGKLNARRVASAVQELFPGEQLVRFYRGGADCVRFSSPSACDRLLMASRAVQSAFLMGLCPAQSLAEYSKGAAHYAELSKDLPLDQAWKPSTLINRGRFWVDCTDISRVVLTAMPEYVFEGRYDFPEIEDPLSSSETAAPNL